MTYSTLSPRTTSFKFKMFSRIRKIPIEIFISFKLAQKDCRIFFQAKKRTSLDYFMMGVCPKTNYIFVVRKKYMEGEARERKEGKATNGKNPHRASLNVPFLFTTNISSYFVCLVNQMRTLNFEKP